MSKNTLNNSYLEVSVQSKGAELTSIKSRKTGIEYLWQADPEYWGRNAPVLFPIVGRLKDNEYLFHDTKYHLNQHGFARDMEFELVDQTNDRITFQLQSDRETVKKFPFQFKLFISYTLLENTISTKYTVLNEGQSEMLFSIGGHPAYNCPIISGETFEDYHLEFENDSRLIRYLLKDGLITNETEEIILTDKQLPLDYILFEKDAIVLKNLKSEKISLKNVKGNGLTFQFKSFPFFGIWTAKSGAPFICLEPWHGIADHNDHSKNLVEKDGIIRLVRGKSFSCEYIVEVLEN